MEKLIEKLNNPFDGIIPSNEESFQKKCAELANDLFNNYCIQCGEKKFYFAEIEFYYYEKGRWEKDWNEKTYPRKGKKGGEFFFHYSGFDICFESDYNDSNAKFGGILIRSLKDDDGKYITGPSVCSLEILNTCSNQKIWPQLKPCHNACKICDIPIGRYGITYKNNHDDKPLCFYDENLKENLKNEFENATWEYGKYKNGTIKGQQKLTRYYHRFDK